MQLLRYIVRQLSPWGTYMRSDTLCGLVLTRLVERAGPKACRAAIDEFRAGNPPFILSSLLPCDMVFTPRLPSPPRSQFRAWVDEGLFVDEHGKRMNLFSALEKFKQFRKTPYLPLELWIRHAQQLSLKPLLTWFCQSPVEDAPKPTTTSLESHVTIDRMRRKAAPGGYFCNRLIWSSKDASFHLYARAKDPAKLLETLQEIGDIGFGHDATSGKGRFTIEEDTSFDRTTLENAGPHGLLCSVCSAQTMTGFDGWYAVLAKRGKAGPLISSPHKATLLLVQEGSVVRSLPQGPFVLEGINSDTNIVQITQPLLLPCHLTEEVPHA